MDGKKIGRRALLIGGPVAVLATTGLVLWGDPPGAQAVPAGTPSVPPPDHLLRPWGQLPPEAKAGTGVAVAPSGDVLLLHRAGTGFAHADVIDADVVAVLDPRTGATRHTWGGGMFRSPHGIATDAAGNAWVTDITTNLVTVHDAAGRLLRTVGSEHGSLMETCLRVRNVLTNLPCGGGDHTFGRPTGVAVATDRSFYVADGYRNSRVAHFDDAGELIGEWGELGDAPGEFQIPHGIALGADRVYVADRRNARVQVFAPDGTPLAQWRSAEIGRPYDVTLGPDGRIFVLDGGDTLDIDGGELRAFVVELSPAGTVVDRWALADQECSPHALAVSNAGDLYVAALTGPPLHRWSPGA